MADVNINPDHDAFVNKAAPDTNYGDGDALHVRRYSSQNDRLSYLHFPEDEVPVGQTINSAILWLYVDDGLDIEPLENNPIYKNDEAFDEDVITWNDRPGISGGSLGTVSLRVTGWVSLDITSTFADWYNGVISNYGIQINPDESTSGWLQSTHFDSKEATNIPYIAVNYSPAAIVKTFEDSGVGIDSLLTDKTLIFPDTAAGVDVFIVDKGIVTKIFEDTGLGTDLFKVDKTLLFSDAGVGVDIFLVDKEATFKDVGSAIDKFRAAYPYPKGLKRKIIIIRDLK